MTEHTKSGSSHSWHDSAHAEEWIAKHEKRVEGPVEEFRVVVALLPFPLEQPARVLELGAGNGGLTRTVLEACPAASVLALDVSPTMIADGRRRLARFGDRLRYVEWDLESPGWPEEARGPFDAVVTSLALHHLGVPERSVAAQHVLACLAPGGGFLNLDNIRPSSESLKVRYQQAHERLGSEPGGGGHSTATLEEEFGILRNAGFVDVDVLWKRFALAIVGGSRPG